MNEIDCADQKHIFRGELALLLVIIMNSFGVVLMLYSGSGISAISSVPYAFSEVFPFLSLGTWTYIFQAILIASLMILRKHFVIEYLLSFVVGFAFSMMLDVHKGWISILPYNIPMRIIYFCISYLLLCLGIALSNRCGLCLLYTSPSPRDMTDLFPRELSVIKNFKYSKVKISFDVICLATTALITGIGIGRIKGLGIGTVLAAFTMGKVIGIVGETLDKHFRFVTFRTAR